jgi:hypothetical protein
MKKKKRLLYNDFKKAKEIEMKNEEKQQHYIKKNK